jgi:LacI family transcriptional regulator
VAEGRGNGGRRPTMRDVARVAGVSPSAVSFVLNDRRDARIGQEARERILAAVEQLGSAPTSRRGICGCSEPTPSG